ncbi:MAG: FAD-dependent thymidylate synthase [Treponema sp.]|jgi:thymidylate synthase (FAD)|nr:FAD-dependent thymidylate synthase [Treponema sp.]
MKIVEQSHMILYPCTEDDWETEYKLIELAGRTAYKSENKISAESHIAFIKGIVSRNHLAVIEFGNIVVHFVTDRGITHELVRYRLCSFVQESTRYCNYGSGKFGNEVAFVMPSGLDDLLRKGEWIQSCRDSEDQYLKLLEIGCTPQQARAVLPNCTKTEIVVKANFREWRHVFELRAVSKDAHPDMRLLMIPLYEEVRAICPQIFDLGDPE